jgi:dTDP-4-dehydrorhamnose 3,5-epimerase
MKITKTEIEGLLILEPRVFKDDRGLFFESFNHELFTAAAGPVDFIQDNQSVSEKGVLRGLHFQNSPHAQGKLVRVAKGRVIDVAVDIRKDSATYGEHVAVELSAENNKQFWVPAGFAHGFVSLEDDTIFCYKCTDYYAPECEGSLLWNDTDLSINWGIDNPLVSEKDAVATKFANFTTFFK